MNWPRRLVHGQIATYASAHMRSGVELRKLQAWFRDAVVVAKAKNTKLRWHLCIALGLAATHVEQVQSTLTRLGGSAADRLREVLSSLENERRKVIGSSRDASVAMSHKITKFRSQLSKGFEQDAAELRRARNMLMRLANSVLGKPARLRQELRTRENELHELLISSLDGIVVTDDSHHFVTANSKALELFGVSEKNAEKFTIDAFLSHGQRLGLFDTNSGSPFIGRREGHGKCKIRRLDGSQRIVECVWVANFFPFQHLCRFCDVTPPNRRVSAIAKVQPTQRQTFKQWPAN